MPTAALDLIRTKSFSSWQPAVDAGTAARLRSELEEGCVLHLPELHFELEDGEARFLDPRWSDGKSKNINVRADDSRVRGAAGNAEDMAALLRMIVRFSRLSEQLVLALFPDYGPLMQRAGTSLRTTEIEGRPVSWRKDDTRLHVDSFPSNPLHGKRLLRVFQNLDPEQPRVWRVGEPFADFAQRYVPRTHGLRPGQAWLMAALHITKRPRSEYDHRMLQLHDMAKADAAFQGEVPQQEFAFAPHTSWIVFSDQVLHAATRGRALIEQTFYVDPQAIADTAHSPEAVLSRMVGHSVLAA